MDADELIEEFLTEHIDLIATDKPDATIIITAERPDGNTGDHERDGNTSYNQGDTHNTDQQRKPGTMSTNYHNTPNSSTNIGISIGMTITWNQMEEKHNSSRDACLNKGGNVTIYSLFLPFYLPNRDSGPVGPLINTSAWHSHVIAPTLHIFASILRATSYSPMQSTTRDLYIYLHIKYLSSSSYSMYPSLELTLIYTETYRLFPSLRTKDLVGAPIT